MRSSLAAALALVSFVVVPLRAAEIRQDEALVLRLIFEDCLGYIRSSTEPFQGLRTRPASAAAIEQLPGRMPNRENAVELLSPRYVASWGEDGLVRHCMIRSSSDAASVEAPGLLGVAADSFLQRVTVRAAAAGLSHAEVAETFSPIYVNLWSEPETGHENGPMRPVRLSMIATSAPDAQGMADAGLIVMSGPPGGRR